MMIIIKLSSAPPWKASNVQTQHSWMGFIPGSMERATSFRFTNPITRHRRHSHVVSCCIANAERIPLSRKPLNIRIFGRILQRLRRTWLVCGWEEFETWLCSGCTQLPRWSKLIITILSVRYNLIWTKRKNNLNIKICIFHLKSVHKNANPNTYQ